MPDVTVRAGQLWRFEAAAGLCMIIERRVARAPEPVWLTYWPGTYYGASPIARYRYFTESWILENQNELISDVP